MFPFGFHFGLRRRLPTAVDSHTAVYMSTEKTPVRHAALLRIRCNLTVQVLFAMPADPGSRIRMM